MRVAIVCVACILAWSCLVCANPSPRGSFYVDFDYPNCVSEITLDQYELIEAHLVVREDGDWTPYGGLFSVRNGLVTISLRVEITPGAYLPGFLNFENLLPGDLTMGDWETGISIASTQCNYVNPTLPVARVTFLATGQSGTVALLHHPEWGGWVDDCASNVGEWYSYDESGWGHIYEAATPVENVSWTAIKAMYR